MSDTRFCGHSWGETGFNKPAEAPASWKPRELSVRLVNSYHQNIRSWLGLTTNNPYIGWWCSFLLASKHDILWANEKLYQVSTFATSKPWLLPSLGFYGFWEQNDGMVGLKKPEEITTSWMNFYWWTSSKMWVCWLKLGPPRPCTGGPFGIRGASFPFGHQKDIGRSNLNLACPKFVPQKGPRFSFIEFATGTWCESLFISFWRAVQYCIVLLVHALPCCICQWKLIEYGSWRISCVHRFF